jgi:thioredoxin reductase/Pyruvate/2-oxoacid:ferredoxin oxidoreductase delta subunit
VFVAIGAQVGKLLGIPGENGDNVYTAPDFLRKVNSNVDIDVGPNVVVVGGGNAAMDVARVCCRKGAKVTVLSHQSENEMPAIASEVTRAKEEGVTIALLHKPIEIMHDEKRMIVRCQRTKPGELDRSGCRAPIALEGETLAFECTTVVTAIGQEVDFSAIVDCAGEPFAMDAEGRTRVAGVYAGGDMFEPALVATAIAHGNRAALTVHRDLSGLSGTIPCFSAGSVEASEHASTHGISETKMNRAWFEKRDRMAEPESVDADVRMGAPDCEVTAGCSLDQAVMEAKRCMSCGYCFDCGHCWAQCGDSAIVRSREPGDPCIFDHARCVGCGKCWEQCPSGSIEPV